jgi:hypothetical protein
MKLIAAALLVMLAGCTSLDTFRAGIATQGADLNDRALVDAEWLICNAISVGAWRRAYGSNPDKAQAWRALCRTDVTQTP